MSVSTEPKSTVKQQVWYIYWRDMRNHATTKPVACLDAEKQWAVITHPSPYLLAKTAQISSDSRLRHANTVRKV